MLRFVLVLLTLLSFALGGAIVFFFEAANAQTTPVTEVNTAALTGPFDMSPGRITYLTIHAPGAFSPSSGLPQVLVHVTF